MTLHLTPEISGDLTLKIVSEIRHELFTSDHKPTREDIKVGWVFTFAAAAYNLVRMRNLLSPAIQEV